MRFGSGLFKVLRGAFGLVLVPVFLLACADQTATTDNTIRVAVASNFSATLRDLKPVFESETGYSLSISTGSSGKLFAQIAQAAPFDVFLSADDVLPARLVNDGLAAESTQFTYAYGQLVLWSAKPDTDLMERMSAPGLRRLAIANPSLAPYGRAAMEYLTAEGLLETVSDKLVYGENVGQTFAFVETRNAELGFVAYSQILSRPERKRGVNVLIDAASHAPIRQDGVILNTAADDTRARAFMSFLQSDTAIDIIETAGYRRP